MKTRPNVPNDVSFQAAIEVTQQLLDYLDQAAASPRQGDGVDDIAIGNIADVVSAVVQQKQGARGFFVAYLTGEHTVASPPHPAIVAGLQKSPAQSVDLLAKNLAMSTAMTVAHRRDGNADMAQQSIQVRSRTIDLMVALQLPRLATELTQLRDSAQLSNDVDGGYEPFLTRWGYDAEQRQHIHDAAVEVLARLNRQPTDGG